MSPCIKKCALNKCGICTGCFRTIKEIESWNKLSYQEQNIIINRCKDIILHKQAKK